MMPKLNVDIWQCDSKKGFPRCIGAWIIKKFQSTEYTHYCIRVSGEYYDATLTKGVSHRPKEDFFNEYTLHGKAWRFEIDKFSEFLEFHSYHDGKKYGILQAAGIGLKWAFRWAQNPFGNGSNKLICNEYAIRCLNHFTSSEIENIDDVSLIEAELLLTRYLGDPHVVS